MTLAQLVSSAKQRIKGPTPSGFAVTGVKLVVCNPPNTWTPGKTFICYAYVSSGLEVGELHGTVQPNVSSGAEYNAEWLPNADYSIPTTVAPTTTTTAPATPVVLQTLSGSGIQNGPQFTVPSSANGWTIAWSYNCSSFGSSGDFIITVAGFGAAADTTDVGVAELGTGQSGTSYNYDTGTFQLQVKSECNWNYTVKTIPAPTNTTATTSPDAAPGASPTCGNGGCVNLYGLCQDVDTFNTDVQDVYNGKPAPATTLHDLTTLVNDGNVYGAPFSTAVNALEKDMEVNTKAAAAAANKELAKLDNTCVSLMTPSS
jgi:hypothetical protein